MKNPSKIPLASTIRQLENDFSTDSDSFNDSLRLAISSLMSGDFELSRNQFNKCIESNSKNPAGWLGRAYVEVMDIEPIEINETTVDEYVLRARQINPDGKVDKYLEILTAIIGFQQASAIKILKDYTLSYREQEARAAFNAILGAGLGVIGAVVGSSSKSLMGKVAGYSMLGSGVGISIHQSMDKVNFKRLKNSAFGEAIAQTYISVPIISFCYQTHTNTTDKDFKANLKVVLDSWKDSVFDLYEWLRSDLIHRHLLTDQERSHRLIMIDFLDMVGLNESEAFQFLEKRNGFLKTVRSIDKKAEILYEKNPRAAKSSFGRFVSLSLRMMAIITIPLYLVLRFVPEGTTLYSLGTWGLLIVGVIMMLRLSSKDDKVADQIKQLEKDLLTIIEKNTIIEKSQINFELLGAGSNTEKS